MNVKVTKHERKIEYVQPPVIYFPNPARKMEYFLLCGKGTKFQKFEN